MDSQKKAPVIAIESLSDIVDQIDSEVDQNLAIIGFPESRIDDQLNRMAESRIFFDSTEGHHKKKEKNLIDNSKGWVLIEPPKLNKKSNDQNLSEKNSDNITEPSLKKESNKIPHYKNSFVEEQSKIYTIKNQKKRKRRNIQDGSEYIENDSGSYNWLYFFLEVLLLIVLRSVFLVLYIGSCSILSYFIIRWFIQNFDVDRIL